jgi:hypothetical protein
MAASGDRAAEEAVSGEHVTQVFRGPDKKKLRTCIKTGLNSDLRLGCNICYGSFNLFLITIISGLIMHDMSELINSESS